QSLVTMQQTTQATSALQLVGSMVTVGAIRRLCPMRPAPPPPGASPPRRRRPRQSRSPTRPVRRLTDCRCETSPHFHRRRRLVERKNPLPVVLHADHCPAVFLGFVI